MLEHVFGEAVARSQIEHMWPIHDREDHQERDVGDAARAGQPECSGRAWPCSASRLAPGVWAIFGLGGHQPVPRLRILGNLRKLGVEIGGGVHSWHG